MSTVQSKSVAFVALVLGAVVCGAFGDPPPVNGLVGKDQLSPQDRVEVRTYTDFYCNQLAAGDIQAAERAKRQLLDPLRSPVISGDFHLEYSKVLVGNLAAVIDGDKPHAAVNAMLLIGFLGTDRALDVIKDHLDSKDENRFEMRLWAAKAFGMAAEAGQLDANDLNPLLRQFEIACRNETEPSVLLRQFEAIASVNSAVARSVLLGAIGEKLDVLQAQPQPSRQMDAIYPALVRLRGHYLSPILNKADQLAFGKDIASLLYKVFEVGSAHWDTIQADENTRKEFGRSYKGAIGVAESLLKTIDRRVRAAEPPRTQLITAWEDVDKPRFDAEHRNWADVLSRPPYNGH